MKRIKLFEGFLNENESIQVGKVYLVTGELNGELQEFPSDSDFEEGTKLLVLSGDVKKDTVIAVEAESDSDKETWAFDLTEFQENTKVLGR